MKRSQVKIELYRAAEKLIGTKLIRRHYLSKCVSRYLDANCIFVHIPKAAGTSVAVATLGRRAGHFTAREMQEFMGREKFGSMFSFSVTREPLDRLKSAYNYVVNEGGEHGGLREEEVFRSRSFRDFNAFVQEWLVFQDLTTTNLLFKPQHSFICEPSGNVMVNYVGKIENTSAVEMELSQHLGKAVQLGRKNRTRSHKKPINVSPETATLVQELYQKDYSILQY